MKTFFIVLYSTRNQKKVRIIRRAFSEEKVSFFVIRTNITPLERSSKKIKRIFSMKIEPFMSPL